MKRYSLSELARTTGATLVGDPSHSVSGVAPLEEAESTHVSFLANARYLPFLPKSKAGVICIAPTDSLPENKNLLISPDPSETFQKISQLFFAERKLTGFTAVHPTAVIHPTATICEEVTIAPYVVVDEGAVIGKGTTLLPFVSIGPYATIGENCLLHAHAVVREYCQLKNRVILQPGAIVGSCGFGYLTNEKGGHKKLEQFGIVILEDDVEVGANTTIDRARFKATIVQRGTKIDNLVQLGHNVNIGEDNLIISLTGIAGSTKTGKQVVFGGQVGVNGHIEIADGALIAAKAGVTKSIHSAGKYSGNPALPAHEHNRNQVYLRRIEEAFDRIAVLEEKLKNSLT